MRKLCKICGFCCEFCRVRKQTDDDWWVSLAKQSQSASAFLLSSTDFLFSSTPFLIHHTFTLLPTKRPCLSLFRAEDARYLIHQLSLGLAKETQEPSSFTPAL